MVPSLDRVSERYRAAGGVLDAVAPFAWPVPARAVAPPAAGVGDAPIVGLRPASGRRRRPLGTLAAVTGVQAGDGVLLERTLRARARMHELGIDVALLSVGPDLPYLTGYEAMPLERLTMLVLPRDGEAVLVVPGLEAPRVQARPTVFRTVAWSELDDPVALVAHEVGASARVAVGDHTWARFVLALQDALPGAAWTSARAVVGPLREIKDAAEVDALRAAAAAVDAAVGDLAASTFAGCTEAEVARRFADRILARGHQSVNFTIVAAGPNGASPHHEAGPRVIVEGDVVVCDVGGTRDGYCSDITRMFVVGEPSAEFTDIYGVLREAQEAAVAAATVGTPAAAVDAVARDRITAGGYGEFFVHRTGHGIGIEAHEDPYVVATNVAPLEVGHAFSVEPGIYLPGRFGMRLEDIVVCTADGPESLNRVGHDPIVVG
jgi:Xaa-Pro aminopeptidase